MLYRWLADAVVLVHLGFVLFVVLGGLLVLRRPRLAWLHVPAALWGVWIEFSGRVCPLTPLENRLRRLGGEAGYSGGFIDRYVVSLLYPEGLSRSLQLVLGALVLTLTLAIYARLLWRTRRARSGPRPA
ncbi:MAG TPA: DUF2784 domain-containing protein [Longimicrobiaceae bacterium]|nr:DUF2784 domain-containing protein [Longimicrobiaceae bacterium]